MAKRKALVGESVPSKEELEREAANAAAEAAREREERRRRRNAEKQARYRQSLKDQGYREVKHWEKPPEPGLVKPWGKDPPPLIKESSAGVCERDPAMGEAVKAMMSAFFFTMRGDHKDMSKEAWAVYQDIETLLSPLGYKGEV